MGDSNMPPGFRFYPSDEDLAVHFLHRKSDITELPFHPDVIPDLDVAPYNPWDLQGKAFCEGSKWYYYSRRVQRRITDSGYWNPVGMDEPIISSLTKKIVGMKKYLVFHIGDSPNETRTSWIMYEYRLPDSPASTSRTTSKKRSGIPQMDYKKWVICKVYERKNDDDNDEGNDDAELSCLDEIFLSMDDFDEISLPS